MVQSVSIRVNPFPSSYGITNSQTQNILEKEDVQTCLSHSLEAVVSARCSYSHVNLTQRSALPCILPAILEVSDLVLPCSLTSWWQALVFAWDGIHLTGAFVSTSHSLCELYYCVQYICFSSFSMACNVVYAFVLLSGLVYGSSIQLSVGLSVISLCVRFLFLGLGQR
jgi:hypothetical protein